MILFGDIIKATRQQQCVIQEVLADAIGVSPACLSKYENNKSKVTIEDVKSMSQALGTDLRGPFIMKVIEKLYN